MRPSLTISLCVCLILIVVFSWFLGSLRRVPSIVHTTTESSVEAPSSPLITLDDLLDDSRIESPRDETFVAQGGESTTDATNVPVDAAEPFSSPIDVPTSMATQPDDMDTETSTTTVMEGYKDAMDLILERGGSSADASPTLDDRFGSFALVQDLAEVVAPGDPR
jgi:hypothetical protein